MTDCRRTCSTSTASPPTSLRVEKPWGYEIVFAHTDRYFGKLLFVRKGEQLSLQFHKEKDETIYVHEGRSSSRSASRAGPLDTEVVGAGRRLPPEAGHGAPLARARGLGRARGLDAGARRRRAARRPLRPRRRAAVSVRRRTAPQ